MGSMYDTILSSSSCIVDWDSEIVTFVLYSPTGKIAGTVQYNWKENKEGNNVGRYEHTIRLKAVPFGFEFKQNTKIAVITEGIFDAIRCLEAGFDSYPLFSTCNVPVIQAISLLNYELCYLLDSDCKGIVGLRRNKHLIHSYAISDPDQDPNSMTPERIQELIHQRKPVLQGNYSIAELKQHFYS